MAFCSNCGRQLPDNAQFCSNCGASLNTRTPQPAPKKKKKGGFLVTIIVTLIAWGIGSLAGNIICSATADKSSKTVDISSKAPVSSYQAPVQTEPSIPSNFKEFTFQDGKMYLPRDMSDMSGAEGTEGFDFTMASNDVLLVALEETFTELGVQYISQAEYAQLFMESNGFSSTVQQGDGYHYFLFNNVGYEYIAAFFETGDSIWAFQIGQLDLDVNLAHTILETIEMN